MSTHLFRRIPRNSFSLARAGAVLLAALLSVLSARAQVAFDSPAASGKGRILLVLPFDNQTGQPSLEWVREAAPALLGMRFTSAGFAPMSRSDRMYALDHLGLPQSFQPSRASAIKLAQTLDADSIVVGSFTSTPTGIRAEARIVDVPRLSMSPPIVAEGEKNKLIDVFDSLAWELTKQLDPGFNVAAETFIAAGANLNLTAFEQYIRGIAEPDQAERLRHLQQAVKISPDLSLAWMALGREYYSGQQYEQAAAAFAQVTGTGADALEAGFYRGLSLMFSGNYGQAEVSFAGVARVLPLAAVLNNQGVAVSRQGHDGSALFRQAEAADPSSADYHFNLAVSLNRHGNKAEALTELAQSLKLHPNDSEAQAVDAAWKQAAGAAPVEPLERIERNFDAAAFRQAAAMFDQMEASRLAAMTPQQRAAALSAQAKNYLSRGLLLEADRLYQQAVALDNRAVEAHEGLAEVRERTGDLTGARHEAQAALELHPTVDAYLVLARIDMASNRLDDAHHNAGEALKISPASQAAQETLRQVTARQAAQK